MSLAYGVYKLICDGEQVGYRLVTEVGIFDCDKALSSRGINESDILGSISVINKDGRYYSDEELTGDAYSEVSRTNLQLDILLNSLDLTDLDADLIFGESKLEKYIEPITYLNKRFCFNIIKKFLDSEIGIMRNILVLFGLQGTGKTVMIQQSIKYLLGSGVSSGKIACLTLRDNKIDEVRLLDYISVLYDIFDIDYLFIDELPYAVGNLSFLSILSDCYADKKTVLSGRNSFGFVLLLRDTLFYRAIKVSTTYISYKEFAHLYPDVKLIDYIKAGGILGVDKHYLQSNASIDNYIDASNKYLLSSVVKNLFSCIENFERISFEYEFLSDMYCEDSTRLRVLINNWLQNYGKDLILSIIKDIPVGSADMSMTVYDMSSDSGKAAWKSFKEDVRQLYLSELGVIDKANSFTDEELQEVKQFLKVIDCYFKSDITNYRKSDETSSSLMIFLVPVLLRYALLETLVSVLDSNYDSLDAKYALGVSYSEFKKRLLSTVNGKLFEDVIYLELINAGYDIGVYRDSNEEVDFVYRAKKGIIYTK